MIVIVSRTLNCHAASTCVFCFGPTEDKVLFHSFPDFFLVSQRVATVIRWRSGILLPLQESYSAGLVE